MPGARETLDPHSGQVVGKAEAGFLPRPPRHHHVHDRGDDFARLLDLHHVADADVLLADVVLVVERGAADGAAGQEHRFELGHRRERARAAHLDGDALEPRLGLLGGVLVGNGPARRLRGEAGDFALRKGVQLDDRPVGLVGETAPHPIQFFDGGEQFVCRAAMPGLLRRLEAERFQPGQHLVLPLRLLGRAFDLAEAIEDNVERALGDDARVELLERAGGGVARVGELFLARRFALRVQLLEAGLASDRPRRALPG